MNTEILQEQLSRDGASSCPIEGNEITFSLYFMYIQYIHKRSFELFLHSGILFNLVTFGSKLSERQ